MRFITPTRTIQAIPPRIRLPPAIYKDCLRVKGKPLKPPSQPDHTKVQICPKDIKGWSIYLPIYLPIHPCFCIYMRIFIENGPKSTVVYIINNAVSIFFSHVVISDGI